MVYTVKDLFDTGLLPLTDAVPPADGSPLFNYIVARLAHSFDEADVNQYLSWIQMSDHDTLLAHGLAWHEVTEEWPKIKNDLDGNMLSPLGLVSGQEPPTVGFFTGIQDLKNCHQVLAWGYDLDGSSLTIHVYDPNFIDDQITISLDIGDPAHTTPISVSPRNPGTFRGFFRTHYTYHSPLTPVSAAFVGTIVASPGISSAGPVGSSRQLDWRWCDKCSGLFWAGGGAAAGACPAGGAHVRGTSDYGVVMDAPDAPGQHDWRWCNKCSGLFWAGGGATAGVCPADGAHVRGTSDYSVVA
jgi:hypothetical protein